MRLTIALLCCLFVFSATAQQSFTKVRTGNIRVLNFSSDAEMRQWFLPEYRAYEPTDTLLKKINNYLTGKQLVLVLGTWCSDSQREVPRWMKVLNRAGYDVEYMKIIGAGRNKKNAATHGKQIPHNQCTYPYCVPKWQRSKTHNRKPQSKF